jgi:hypothetical protein
MSIMNEAAWKRSTDEAGRDIPKGYIRFTDGGQVAIWRDDTLAWSITGSGRAWGDPGEMLRAYGDYIVLDVR